MTHLCRFAETSNKKQGVLVFVYSNKVFILPMHD